MGQLRQRVGLVHKLRKLAAAEKLLNGRHNRTDVNKGLRRNGIHVLDRHSLPDNPFHARQPDPKLILQKLTDRAQPPVP